MDLRGLAYHCFFLLAGSLLGGYWFGFEFNKDSTVIATVASSICIYGYCLNIGYFNRINTFRISKNCNELNAKKELEELNKYFSRMNDVSTEINSTRDQDKIVLSVMEWGKVQLINEV